MRTTVRIDDDILEELKARARRENVSLTRLLNRALKAGLQTGATRRVKRPVYREQPHDMGAPRIALDKALAVAAMQEDEEIARELAMRK